MNEIEELWKVISTLEPDARRVLLFIAKRLAVGQETHGILDIATDPRDFRKERAEELADAVVYSAIEELKNFVNREPR